MAKFNIDNYIKVVDNNYEKTLVAIINLWEDDRCAIEQESIFDFEDNTDFCDFVNLYGVKKSVQCYNSEVRFWMGGLAFTEPKAMDIAYLNRFVRDEIDLDYFKDAIAKFGNIDHYKSVIDTDGIEKEIAENDSTKFYLGLEVYRTATHKPAVKLANPDTGWQKIVVADTTEELGKKIAEELGDYYDILDDIAENGNDGRYVVYP